MTRRSTGAGPQGQLRGGLLKLNPGTFEKLANGFDTAVDGGHLIEGVGYRAELKGKDLVLNVGYSHPVVMEAPKDVSFTVENRGKLIIVNGVDKQVVGEICAQIRKVRPPEPYKGKGIRYQGEYIRRKAGKAGKV